MNIRFLSTMARFETVAGGFRTLNDGNRIPMIGLGISRIVGQKSLDVSVRSALQSGYRLFDTARIYENEVELGLALEKYLPEFNLTREDVFITTKITACDADPTTFAHKHLKEALEKLKTSYLDLVLVHYPRDRESKEAKNDNHETNRRGRESVWKVLEEYKESVVIKSIGVSNFMNYHLSEMEKYAKITPAVNQIEYQPYLTQDLIRLQCRQKNILVQAYSSLCWGNEEVLNEPAIKGPATKYNVTPQTILYAFALNTGVGIIPKSANPERINSNLHGVAAVKLTEDEVSAILELDRNTAFCPRCDPWKCL